MKTTITTLMITMMASVCSAQGLKAELETPAMPENPSETWLT